MRKSYPSDISRELFEKIRPQLESCRKRTQPWTVDLYEVCGGILYFGSDAMWMISWSAIRIIAQVPMVQ